MWIRFRRKWGCGKKMEHIIVYTQENHFAGWPANNGLWAWDGTEILVGFTVGAFAEQKGHNIQIPYRSLLARSLDGGQSWQVEEPDNYVGQEGVIKPLPSPIDFANPNLAIRMVGTGYHGNEVAQGCFYYSTNRGRNWLGPFAWMGLAQESVLQDKDLTPRSGWGAILAIFEQNH